MFTISVEVPIDFDTFRCQNPLVTIETSVVTEYEYFNLSVYILQLKNLGLVYKKLLSGIYIK